MKTMYMTRELNSMLEKQSQVTGTTRRQVRKIKEN
jgi:hypothetical protein